MVSLQQDCETIRAVWLIHKLHPLHIWCRLGGRRKFIPLLRLYERTLWRGLRRFLNGRG